MKYKAKFAVCSEIRTKHSTRSEHNLEFLNVQPCGTKRNRWALKDDTKSFNYYMNYTCQCGARGEKFMYEAIKKI